MDQRLDLSVKGVFDEVCADLVIGPKLIKDITLFEQQFVNKNDEHIAFFGGNLFGVNVVRWTDNERDRWFNEIIDNDEVYLTERLLALPTVNKDWVVSSDTFNLSCVWLVNKIFTSKDLHPQQKEAGMIAVMQILQYKFFTSRYYRYFKYPGQRSIAEAMNSTLSGKFLIKKTGNWHALFLYRAREIISSQSIHWKVVQTGGDDRKIVEMLNDVQGRIRAMLRLMYSEYLRVRDSGNRIIATSLIVEHDGEQILKDKKKSAGEYYRYISGVISDRNSFIRVELVKIITNISNTMPQHGFEETLEWMSNNYRQRGAEIIDRVLLETIVHSIEYLSKHREAIHSKTDYTSMLTTLKGGYMSSRSTDVGLSKLREDTELLVRKATNIKNSSVIAAIRTGVLLYIVLRSYTMRYYSS
jgi:hypothetical protein